jgi:hypothetical protein
MLGQVDPVPNTKDASDAVTSKCDEFDGFQFHYLATLSNRLSLGPVQRLPMAGFCLPNEENHSLLTLS